MESSTKKISVSAIVILALCAYVFSSYNLVLLFVSACVVFLFLQKPVKIRIPGFACLLVYLVVGILIGLLSGHPIRNVVRDTSYVLHPIMKIALGYCMGYRLGGKKSAFQTVLVFCAIASVADIFDALLRGRSVFSLYGGSAATSLRFILPIVLFAGMYEFCSNKQLRWVKYIIPLFCFNVVVGLKRTTYLSVAAAILVLLFLLPKNKRLSRRTITRIIIGIILVAIVLAGAFRVLPAEQKRVFFEKWNNTSDELGTKTENWTPGIAARNWRSYEMYLAKETFQNGNIFQKVFGYGYGKIIESPYANRVGAEADGGMTLLHNGFYTVLVKGGLLGVVLFVLFFAAGILQCRKNIVSNYCYKQSTVLIVLYLNVFIKTYLTMGLFSGNIELGWCLLFGWLYADMRVNSTKEEI